MSKKQGKYSKSNPEREMRAEPEKNNVAVDFPLQPFSTNIALTFQKPNKELLPKTFFVIISGGEKREKDYFRIISNRDKFKRIKIEFIADPNKLSPKGMFEIALLRKAHYISSQDENTENPDKIFLVSDVDLFLQELLEIKPKCEEEQLHLIISNSCFEVWLYYAHRSTVPNYTVPDKTETISHKFKEWLHHAIKGGINPLSDVFRIHQNIINAKNNYRENENGIPELFSTNMFELAEELLPLVEAELNKLIEENRNKEIEFRKKKK